MRANATVFYNDYQDFQARIGRAVTSPSQPIPSIDFAVLYAGKLEIYGAELELAANPIAGLRKLKEPRKPRRWLNKDEIAALIAQSSPRFRPLVVAAPAGAAVHHGRAAGDRPGHRP